jgi:DNA polymerase-3 subunit delta
LDGATLKGAWFGALDSHGVSIKVDAVDRKALPQWIAQRLSVQLQRVPSGEAGQRTLQFFADRVEGNLLAAHQEVQKLALLYPAGELSFDQVESAVLNVARYDSFKLAEAVLAGQTARVQRMLDGLQAEGEAPVLVHWALSEDIRTLARVRQALDAGRPMPMALREHRVWGNKEKLMERVLPRLSGTTLTQWLQDAHVVDGIAKGLKVPTWPAEPWDALHRLATQVSAACAVRS